MTSLKPKFWEVEESFFQKLRKNGCDYNNGEMLFFAMYLRLC